MVRQNGKQKKLLIQDIVEEVVSGSNEQTRKCIVTIPSGEASEIQLDLEIEQIPWMYSTIIIAIELS